MIVQEDNTSGIRQVGEYRIQVLLTAASADRPGFTERYGTAWWMFAVWAGIAGVAEQMVMGPLQLPTPVRDKEAALDAAEAQVRHLLEAFPPDHRRDPVREAFEAVPLDGEATPYVRIHRNSAALI